MLNVHALHKAIKSEDMVTFKTELVFAKKKKKNAKDNLTVAFLGKKKILILSKIFQKFNKLHDWLA